MQYQFPFSIETKYGEKITFLRMEGKRLILEGFAKPMAGPAMHVHKLQDEGFTVVSGKIGYQISGEEPRYGGPGETVVFKRGIPHRFWNAGEEELHIKGWVDPADNLIFFLSALYDALNRGKNQRPEMFDAAYIMHRYKNEYDATDIPVWVKKFIMPITYFWGNLTGKYNKFKDAPQPL